MALRSDWSGSSCPIAHAADVLADPWVLLILRELFSGRSRFDELRQATGAAESVLARRLRALGDHDLIRREPGGDYRLTERGRATLPVLHAYARFSRVTEPDGGWGMIIACNRCGTEATTTDWCVECGAPLDPDSTQWTRRSLGRTLVLAETAGRS